MADSEKLKSSNQKWFKDLTWREYGAICEDGLDYQALETNIDVIVDISKPDVFEEVLGIAKRTKKPIIVGTAGLSNKQIATLLDATNRIPVFRDEIFPFKVRKFIDDVVRVVMLEEGRIDLYERFFEGKGLPSETTKLICKKISDVTGRKPYTHSHNSFPEGSNRCEWELRVERAISENIKTATFVKCKITKDDDFSRDILMVAKKMADKPLKKGFFYTMEDLWEEIWDEIKLSQN